MFNQNEWQSFVDVFRDDWESFHDKDKLNHLLENNEDIAIVISQLFLAPNEWLNAPNPSLNGKSPFWCLNHGSVTSLSHKLISLDFVSPYLSVSSAFF